MAARVLTGEKAAAKAAEADPVSDFLVSEFVIESRELLGRFDRDLMSLEREPGSPSLVASIFRHLHTVKGTALCLSFPRFAKVAHAGESLLAKVREGDVQVDAGVVDAMLATGDYLRRILDHVEATHREPEDDPEKLLARLEMCGVAPTLVRPMELPGVSLPSLPMPEKDEEEPHARPHVSAQVRVDALLLDQAAKLTEEIVRLRESLAGHAPAQPSPEMAADLDRIEGATLELSATLRAARLQPVEALWMAMPRVVRNVSLLCGKRVQLETSGGDVELERSITEALLDPLVHLVRNAIDHGIESPAVRQAQGKSPIGRLVLTARRDRGRVFLGLRDDGAGVDLGRVRRLAFRRGLCAVEDGSDLHDREALALILLPGFSTAERVTQVSGRGVGLDVVKSRVEELGGRLQIASEPGKGMKVLMRFADPLPDGTRIDRRRNGR